MKYLKQFLIIVGISCVGDFLKMLIPLPVPASIYGMMILFAGLCTGLIPLDNVKDAGKFLIEIMPVMFIPAGVGLITAWDVLRPILWQIVLVTVVSTVAVMAAGGRCTQFMLAKKSRRGGENE